MRIEISAGGFGGVSAVEYQNEFQGYISDIDSVIGSFKTVQNSTANLNGGAGNLQGALNSVSARIQEEENKRTAAVQVRAKSEDFLNHAVQIDQQVAASVEQNKNEFYQVNPWLKPASSADETTWYEAAWDWLCGAKDAVIEGAKELWTGIKDTAKKAWDGLVAFYTEHKKIIDTVLIIAGAVAAIAAVVVSGGGALVFLLGALGCSEVAAAAISGAVAVVAVVSTLAASTMNIIDIWAEIDNPTFEAWKKGLNIVSGLSNFIYSIGGIYNSFHNISPAQAKAAMQNIKSAPNVRGTLVNGEYVSYLSDYQPGADSAIQRELLTERSTNHFYSIDNPNGGKIYVSADPCTQSGVANVVGNSGDDFIVLSGTHGGPNGGLSFNGSYNFYIEDCNTFSNFSNVQVVNIQNHIASLDINGMATAYNQAYFQNIFSSGKNIVCAWCYSDRSMLVKQILGLF